MSLAKAHEVIDGVVDQALRITRKRGHKVPCADGCAACCYEPVYVERREAQALVDALAGQREELTRRTQEWWNAFFQGGFNSKVRPRKGEGYAALLAYRSARLACPVLRSNLCSAYATRPVSCRSHLALGSRRGCEDNELRTKQQFVEIDSEAHVVALYAIDPESTKVLLEFDHLGIWLGHILLGKKERSAAGEDRFLDNVAIESWLQGRRT